MASTLELTLVFLLAAVAGVVVCRLARLPPMLGYLAVGVVLGRSVSGIGSDTAGVTYLAEFGIVFLMFVIGLEFNLPKLQSMRRLVFGLGFTQVRSEEHTSELQSRRDLVCRLLLEKKKNYVSVALARDHKSLLAWK